LTERGIEILVCQFLKHGLGLLSCERITGTAGAGHLEENRGDAAGMDVTGGLRARAAPLQLEAGEISAGRIIIGGCLKHETNS
jgi:hypothetical protein